MGQKHLKVATLFSGGWDSAVALHKAGLNGDIYFVDYGQRYLQEEYKACLEMIQQFNLNKNFHTVDLKYYTDVPFRNFILILHLLTIKKYDVIIIGSRNLLPFFDKYLDSNWLSLKIIGLLTRTKIELPVTLWSKKRIVNYCKKYIGISFYNCYRFGSSCCGCANCQEMRALK